MILKGMLEEINFGLTHSYVFMYLLQIKNVHNIVKIILGAHLPLRHYI